jgi:hypothetical protein
MQAVDRSIEKERVAAAQLIAKECRELKEVERTLVFTNTTSSGDGAPTPFRKRRDSDFSLNAGCSLPR